MRGMLIFSSFIQIGLMFYLDIRHGEDIEIRLGLGFAVIIQAINLFLAFICFCRFLQYIYPVGQESEAGERERNS